MRILLTTLNSKYIHSNLALRYLRAACPEQEILLQEYTINDRLEVVAGEIFKTQADIIGLSCYIWNIEATLELVGILRQVAPDTVIILGGPEVSYDPAEYLAQGADYVVFGEGELTFCQLIDYLQDASSREWGPEEAETRLASIQGLAYLGAQGPKVNSPRPLLKELAHIASPYAQLDGLEHKIAYVESSRGCPFNCQYCLSSTLQGVRFFPLERTKEELVKLVEAGVTQIKFVDRTFNCDKQHALEVMRFIADWNPRANFHFEISADLLDQAMLDFLSHVPAGLFQLEVGVQSTNLDTLDKISRRTDLHKLSENVKAVKAGGRIAQFLDLIAGLPGEDYQSFANSFNEVYSWGPDKIQLGFLKLLKGSGMRQRAPEWGYHFVQSPPYQVLENRWLSYAELLRLQTIEDLVDKFYNSGHFSKSLTYLAGNFGQNPFAMFESLAEYWQSQGYHRQAHKARNLYDILLEFYQQQVIPPSPIFAELLKLDYLLWEQPTRNPEWFAVADIPYLKERVDSFFRQGLPTMMPQLKEVSRREIHKYFHLEPFNPTIGAYLDLPLLAESDEPLYLLFYYPGPLLKAERPGFIPVVI